MRNIPSLLKVIIRSSLFTFSIFCSDLSLAEFSFNPSDFIVEMGLGKPSFSNLNHYSDVYGGTSFSPSLSVGYKNFRSSSFSLGWGVKFSHYSDKGKTLIEKNRGQRDYVRQEDGDLSLTLSSYEPYLFFNWETFDRQLVFSTKIGYRETFAEESRSFESNDDSSSTTTDTSTVLNANNQEWNKSLTLSFAVNFLITYIEEAPPLSLEKTTGLYYIYVGPFVEVSSKLGSGNLFLSQQKSSPVDYTSGTVFGLQLSFET